ncbi:(2R)-3-sulfolactate dehydrogenase (NADP+) [Mesorhizobium albiziae]|uniref:(2R)-3-sulfolactate dehydrogenase (NADP+) n=1 Tax=Neomesorhizobium albiziae TaxID=335020 RepID=A0A1I3WXU1_9HYPH|nr:Ldh family oxidoreductase [Mesorhizobium albiziae]GLS31933.1 malate dehydrogenase [Mesorhizobium albiziae]SFK11767.1 (2R)-3-sulfolactate dehydrogenase (NADP+) [Mesorhizobium albiziae]
MTDMKTLGLDEARALCEQAAMSAGASAETAQSIARAMVAAEADGQASVGLAHFIDYLTDLQAGRIKGKAAPEITRPAPAIVLSNAHGGAAHPGFDMAFDDLVAAARACGVAIFSQKNSYTCGALGYFTGRLVEAGFVALATTNGPPIVAGSGGTRAVYCTNPMSFAAPQDGGPPLLIDQSSSATAFVNVRKAAAEGRPIPAGWALDSEGRPTTDANAAMKGVLLAFGGERGANIALMVDVLSAGLPGANWSVEAPPFGTGSDGPGTGMFVLAIDPQVFGPGFGKRMRSQIERLGGEYGVHIPGLAKAAARQRSADQGISVPDAIYRRIAEWPGR